MLRLLAFMLILAVPSAAFADQPDPDKTHVELSASAYNGGGGVRAGLRMRWVGLEAGVDSSGFRNRGYLGLELTPLHDQVVSPYVYGRLGTWDEQALFGNDRKSGPYTAFGGGLSLHVTDTLFLLFELGGSRDVLDGELELQARLGLGIGF